ncbi:MAG: ABC transporter permease [Acidimicrobiia bacterium]|nr:ABC transporter permease [bacterium]MYB25482.1 ABC transporter permease [Acidimicrobiia bacterium]
MAALGRLASRLAQTAAVVLVVSFVTYWMLSLLPSDPCFLSVGTGATEELLAECRQRLELDRGLLAQYGAWLANMLTGDLGESYRNGITVTESLGQKLPVTGWLVLYTTVLSAAVSLPLGLWSAVRRDTWVDRLISGGAFSLLALPSFILGVVLALVFAAKLRWFDLGGYVGPTEDLLGHWKSLLLPVVTLTAGIMPFFLRLLRSDVIATLQEDYVEAARAKGLPRRWILARHVLRPSSFTVVTVAGLNAAQLVNGALVVEIIYDLDGMGTYLISAVFNQDFLVVQTLVALIAAAFVATNMLVDAAYPLLDPRVREPKR